MQTLVRFFARLAPPARWRIPVVLVLGLAAGIGAMILHLSRAVSYFSDEPRTCVNCHVMAPQYATWQHGSHARVATCNECHVPQDNAIRSYAFKAADGLRHAFMFTFRLEPQVIVIKEAGKAVVQENCIRCHSDLHGIVTAGTVTLAMADRGEGRLCWDCHLETPHGRVNSLASAPHARVPRLARPLPEWLTGK